MGLWKNAGVSSCLQYDYGYENVAAELTAQMMGEMEYLPGTQFPIKRLKKQEIAAWIATAACMPPDGIKADDPSYHRHVQLMLDQEHRKGKIRVPMYRELLECFDQLV